MRSLAACAALPLLLQLARRASAGFIQAGIEQADNYGRNNFLATLRPLQGWLWEDDKSSTTSKAVAWTTLSVTTQGLPENIFGQNPSPPLIGPNWLRPGAGTVTNYACDGFGAGSHFLATKMGVFKNFRRLTVDVLPYEGGAWGVTFNYVKKAFTPASTAFNPVFSYNLVFRSTPGQELCWGAYRLDGSGPTALARSGNSSAFTFVVGRMHTLTVVKIGPNMNFALMSREAGLPDISITGSFVDPAAGGDLPAGHVGLLSNGIFALGVDNFFIEDAPLCTDGLLNGDEEGPDCGGSCPAACSYPVTLTHNWADRGLAGWETKNFGLTGDAGRYWVETDGKLWQRVNHGTDHAGGTNCRVMWQGHYLFASHWGKFSDFDLDVTQQNFDNDGAGFVFRYVDADNFYIFITNNEECCASIRRRRAGIDTMLPVTGLAANTRVNANGIGTVLPSCSAQPTGGAYTTGAANLWKFRVRGNVFQWFRDGNLLVESYDTEDGASMAPGMVSSLPHAFAHTRFRARANGAHRPFASLALTPRLLPTSLPPPSPPACARRLASWASAAPARAGRTLRSPSFRASPRRGALAPTARARRFRCAACPPRCPWTSSRERRPSRRWARAQSRTRSRRTRPRPSSCTSTRRACSLWRVCPSGQTRAAWATTHSPTRTTLRRRRRA